MDTLAIFGMQFVMSLVVYGLIAKWYVVPWLAKRSKHEALMALTNRFHRSRRVQSWVR